MSTLRASAYLARARQVDICTDRKYRAHLCGYDLTLTYPQSGKLAPLKVPTLPGRETTSSVESRSIVHSRNALLLLSDSHARHVHHARTIPAGTMLQKRDAWLKEKRDLSGRGNDKTLDPEYGCFIFSELVDYALNFSSPWRTLHFFTPRTNAY